MNKKVLKYLKIFGISLAIAIVLLFTAGFIIVRFYEDEITQYFITELNKKIDTEVSVDKVELSVWENFPNAAVVFKNVKAKSTKNFNKNDFSGQNAGALIQAQSIALSFNLFDIFNKRYQIKKMSVNHGFLNLYTDARGKDNYHFLKESKSADTSNFEFKLKKIFINDFKVNYIDKKNAVDFSVYASDFRVKGDFSTAAYSMATEGELKLESLTLNRVNYIKNSETHLDVKLAVNNNEFTIEKGDIGIADMKFSATGKITYKNKVLLNLQVNGQDINVPDFLSLLPEQISKYKDEYNSDGEFYFNSRLAGYLDSAGLNIDAKFGVRNGKVKKSGSDIEITNLSLEGSFSNGPLKSQASSVLIFDKFNAKIGNSRVNGQMSLKNFTHPELSLFADADLNLKEWQEFFKVDTIEKIDGHLKVNVDFKSVLNEMGKLCAGDFLSSSCKGTIIAEKVNLSLKDDAKNYSNINGIFTFTNNDLVVNDLALMINENDLQLKGTLINFLSFVLLPEQKLAVTASIKSNKLNAAELLVNGKNQKSGPLLLPENITLEGNLDVQNLSFEKFSAKNFNGTLIYSKSSARFVNLGFESFQGKFSGSGLLEQTTDKKLLFSIDANLERINITQLFETFGNFGQDFLKSNNLKGSLNAKINFSSEWSPSLECDLKKLAVASSVEIKNGELIDFKPMEEMGRFIDVAEVKRIKFSDLKNDILIKNQKIIIPQMDISSNAFNVSLSGEQGFDFTIEYHLKLLLSDVLFKKARKNKDEEFGPVEDDASNRNCLFLIISGTTDDFKIRYDTRKAKEKIKEDIKEEKKNIKAILNDEFGLFKKDSAVLKHKKKMEDEQKEKDKKKVKIKWDENAPGEVDRSNEE